LIQNLLLIGDLPCQQFFADKCIDFLLAPDSEPVQKQFKKRPRILVHDMKILSMQVIL
jgi:hypothetical protein